MEKIVINAVKVSEFSESGVEEHVRFGFMVETEIGNVIATPYESFEETKETLEKHNIRQTFIDHINPTFLSNMEYYYTGGEDESDVIVDILGKQFKFVELFPGEEL